MLFVLKTCLIDGIFSAAYEDLKFNKKHDIDELYREIKQRHDIENRVVLPHIQHPSFKPQLRGYQQQAITWMVQKEKQAQSDQDYLKSGRCTVKFLNFRMSEMFAVI